MAKQIILEDLQKTLNDLKCCRSGWANDIREGWDTGRKGSQELLFSLYEISGCLILALEDAITGHFRDLMPVVLVQRKLEDLVASTNFRYFDELGMHNACRVVTGATKDHIRMMLETLEVLIANG